MAIRLVLVDDQEMVRAGLRLVLEPHSEIEIVGEADDGDTAVRLVREVDADVVLMDVRMPRMNGVEATRRIRAADGPRVLILTTFDLDEYAYDALQAGASGFLLKETPTDGIVDAITHVHQGDAVVAPSTTRRLLDHFTAPRTQAPRSFAVQERLDELTDRELETLRMLAGGLSNAEIAELFVISENTVKTHVSRVLMKLDLRDRVQAVVFAYQNGLV